jgi:hypothetical protein
MLEQVKILASRRAYEYSPDALRLTTLSIQLIQQQIQQLFGFQSSVVGPPIPTFGVVPATYPPGVVFNLGVWIHQEEHIVPIRFVHFEQNRIVIDVAGPSAAIDGIADRLFHFLSGLRAADGSPVVGEPERILDYSEITARFSYPLDVIFPKPLRRLLSKTMGIGADNESRVIIPTVAIQAFPKDEVLPAIPSANDAHAFTFALRSGTRPDEYIYYSGAPLDSEMHLSYLNELEAVLSRSHQT